MIDHSFGPTRLFFSMENWDRGGRSPITSRAINAFRRNWVVRAKDALLRQQFPGKKMARIPRENRNARQLLFNLPLFIIANLISPIPFELRFLMRGHLCALEFRLNARSNGRRGRQVEPNSVVRCSNNGNGGKISRNTPDPSLSLSVPIKRIFPLLAMQSRELNSSSTILV